ncbi:sensor histidine kinase [Arsukibacterium sp.]|uniref:sensor histidine kinase n=1 Tax=Arsukibacterium sp. TaxID=1977258 RepID=UPI00299F3C7E|nr:histidine kinase [Arsukibacterium sp.]MDX1677940.1 histidine kinase [Arsukibacterium sp.]
MKIFTAVTPDFHPLIQPSRQNQPGHLYSCLIEPAGPDMLLVSRDKLLRFNLYYWLTILILSLLGSWQVAVISEKPYNWNYIPMMLASELVAMLLTAIIVIRSHQQLAQQTFNNVQLILGVILVALVYIPAENALWLLLWDKEVVDARLLIGNLDTSVLAFFVWTACYLTLLLYQQQLKRLAQTTALSQKIQQLELQALSQQLNPHFTFNALNSVCALLEASRFDDAEKMSEQLATFLRYSLSKSPDSLVQLADELAAIDAYLQLQKTRFGDKLKVNWQIEEQLKRQRIPALLLQPLVENAIKYAVATRTQGATITIGGCRQQDSLHLVISDDGPGSQLPAHCAGAGVGLDNIRNRLLQHFGDKARLETGATPQGFVVNICLPWQSAC